MLGTLTIAVGPFLILALVTGGLTRISVHSMSPIMESAFGNGMEAPKNISAKVTVDLFSGAPNPSWHLSTEQARAIYSKFLDLPIVNKPMDISHSLGYRGIIVTIDTDGVQKELLLFGGMAQSGRVLKLDANCSLELMVANSGKRFLDLDLFNLILREICKH